jgi:NAD(P)H-flavin reductase
MFATRLRDTAFKRVLQKTPIGTIAKIDGPFGDLTLHNNVSRPAILLARGHWGYSVSQHHSPRCA